MPRQATPTVCAGFESFPCLLISPYAPRGVVSHELFDHTSVLRLIEWRWRLAPLTVRDANANNLANALDFSRRRGGKRGFLRRVPPGPFGVPCPSSEANPWLVMRDMAGGLGFPI